MEFVRKADHIEICLTDNVDADYNCWEDVNLVHNALPELNMKDIDTSISLFGKKLNAPIIISAITGGFEGAEKINRNLAQGAATAGVGMGVGSQRPALEDPLLSASYELIKDYDVPLVLGNIGAPQLVQQDKAPLNADDCRKAVEMVSADVLAVHMNFLQEIVQPEGDTNAKGCLEEIGNLSGEFSIVAKETGGGLSQEVAQTLKKKGVAGLDVGGLGGTSFAAVEYYRAKKKGEDTLSRLGKTFWNWGIPTPVSVILADVGLPIIATGGLRNGLDIARSISLGANAGGLARTLLTAANESAEAVEKELDTLIAELKGAMFLVGASTVNELNNAPVLVTGKAADWLNAIEMQG
jgi:isopentenyl-diphosphate delta-isomerase